MRRARSFAALAATLLAAQPAAAQPVAAGDAAPAGIVLELNGAQPSEKGCRLTFLVSNNLGVELTKAAFEIALFDQQGVVDRMTVLDFRDLPAGKTKVSRFDLAGADCGKISRVLVNTATDCAGQGVDASSCTRLLKPESKARIKFGL